MSDTPEKLAQQFHEAYERLAPSFGYETRKDSAVPWENVPEKNRKLMTAVCAEILDSLGAREQAARLEMEERLKLEIKATVRAKGLYDGAEMALRNATLGLQSISREAVNFVMEMKSIDVIRPELDTMERELAALRASREPKGE